MLIEHPSYAPMQPDDVNGVSGDSPTINEAEKRAEQVRAILRSADEACVSLMYRILRLFRDQTAQPPFRGGTAVGQGVENGRHNV